MMGQGLKLRDNDGSGQGQRRGEERRAPPQRWGSRPRDAICRKHLALLPLCIKTWAGNGDISIPTCHNKTGGQPRKVRARLRNAFDIDIQKNFIRVIDAVYYSQSKQIKAGQKTEAYHIRWCGKDLKWDESLDSSPDRRPGSPSSSQWAWRPDMTSWQPRAVRVRG